MLFLWADVKIKALQCWNKHEVTHVMHVTLVTWIIWCANECVYSKIQEMMLDFEAIT